MVAWAWCVRLEGSAWTKWGSKGKAIIARHGSRSVARVDDIIEMCYAVVLFCPRNRGQVSFLPIDSQTSSLFCYNDIFRKSRGRVA